MIYLYLLTTIVIMALTFMMGFALGEAMGSYEDKKKDYKDKK